MAKLLDGKAIVVSASPGFDRFEADVQKEKLILSDGTHYTQHGYEMLAAAVADSIVGSLK